ncbi:DUF397 domain-containing protein [Actinomadura sp. KC216]|uniref:DUF397 domain-containing protein n=1 Tax=Actinomadura sp. KC216 TaxID=2530370 RepID=UPI001A9D0F75|nr:DUF397 domain-containing protein [Actinomadura sp. KC216]
MKLQPCANWRKSSHSDDDGNCVEVSRTPRAVRVRDSKDPGGPVLNLREADFARLLASIKAPGE